MNIQEFKSYLKTRSFNAINETYNNLYTRNHYRWNREQHAIVVRYVNFEIDNLIDENHGNFPINDTRRETLSSRFVNMLMNVIFDNDNINTPENMIELLELQLPEGRGKKSKGKKSKGKKSKGKKSKGKKSKGKKSRKSKK
jgi:hypothetical protein